MVTSGGRSTPWRSTIRVHRALTVTVALILAVGAVSAAPAVADGGRHRVSTGETLSGIALRFGVSVEALASANALADPHRLLAGTTLTIPTAAAPGHWSAPTGGGSRSHVVAAGEHLGSIARRYGVSVDALVSANALADPNLVVVGRRLVVPADDGSGPPGWPTALRRSPERQALLPVFERAATRQGLPLDLLLAMTWLESGWQAGVMSSTGAVGVGQLMPDTVDFMRLLHRDPTLDPTDPVDNIAMSARYLRWLLDQTGGDPATSLAAYYQGFRAMQERGPYAETLHYVARVLALRNRF